MSHARFEGRRIIVTGGGRGIGATIAQSFADEGGRVAILDRDAESAGVVAKECDGIAVDCDLADETSVADAMGTAVGHLGGVDVLVNNAGIFAITPLLDITADEWDSMFRINTRSMLLTTQHAARVMIDQGRGGAIVNMASMGAKSGAAGQAHYAASKAAVVSLTQVSAAELGAHDITVNCICPGYVLTDMGAGTRTPEMVADWSSKSPLNRLATTSDVAAMATFLASPDAAYCTGQALNINGGMVTH